MAVRRFTFTPQTEFESVRETLLLALWSVESIFGESAVRLATPHSVFEEDRAIEIDGRTRIGRTLTKLLVGLFTREFGNRSFAVERIEQKVHI